MIMMRRPAFVLLALLLGACASPSPRATEVPLATPVPCSNVIEPPEADVFAYFHCAGAELEDPRPVARQSAAGDAHGRLAAALRGLLAGPTPAERDAGYVSLFSDQTALALVSVDIGSDGVAVVDFADFRAALTNASTSTGSQILLAQLNATVLQVQEVAAVEYRIHGSCSAFWTWLQRACTVVSRP
jgi:spore germination protein GerM